MLKRASLFYCIFITFFIQGCEFYHSALQPNLIRERYIQATRKGEILTELQTEAVILATHLNQAYPERFRQDGTYFFVDIYISNDSQDSSKQGLFNPLYSIALLHTTDTIDPIMPIDIKQLDHDEIIHYGFDYVSPWGEYFIVQFPPQGHKKILKLVIERQDLEPVILTFAPSSSSTILNKL